MTTTQKSLTQSWFNDGHLILHILHTTTCCAYGIQAIPDELCRSCAIESEVLYAKYFAFICVQTDSKYSPYLDVSPHLSIGQGTIPFMSANILLGYANDAMTHSPSDNIESLVYVLIWMCVLYAGPSTICMDKCVNQTILKSWVSVASLTDAMSLGGLKTGLKYQLTIITNESTKFFKPLCATVASLLKQLGRASADDHMLNYKAIRDILLEGFGTVEEVLNWSGANNVEGYGLLQQDSQHKHKITSLGYSRI